MPDTGAYQSPFLHAPRLRTAVMLLLLLLHDDVAMRQHIEHLDGARCAYERIVVVDVAKISDNDK